MKYKFIIKIVFTAVVAFLLQIYLPWWSVVIAGFAISFILSSGGLPSFFAGFLGVGLLWFALALFIDNANDGILSNKVAQIFTLPNSFLLVLITAIIGGLSGGFGALTGSYFRKLVLPVNEDLYID